MAHYTVCMPHDVRKNSKIKAEHVSIDNNEPRPLHRHTVKLIDINIKKDWIAFVTEEENLRSSTSEIEIDFDPSSRNKVLDYYLTIAEFSGTNKNVKRYSFKITNYFVPDVANSCTFLSLSPDGKRVALSFLNTDQAGVSIDKYTPFNRNCLIFKLMVESDPELCVDGIIEFQGRAVFSKSDESLILVNTKILKVYDKRNKKKRWFNLRPLGATKQTKTRQSIKTLDYMVNPPWAWYCEETTNISRSIIKDVFSMTRHIRYNILVTSYEEKAQIWSVTENGHRLSSILKEKDEEIMAFTTNYKFLATFNDRKRCINVYNVKSGLIVYTLRPEGKLPEETKFEVSYVRFCREANYLFMIGLEKNSEDLSSTMISFELWHIESEQSIYFLKKKHCVSQKGNKTLQPFAESGDEHILKAMKKNSSILIDCESNSTSLFQEEDYDFKAFYVDSIDSGKKTKIEEIPVSICKQKNLEFCSYDRIYDEDIWVNSNLEESVENSALGNDVHARFCWKRVISDVAFGEDLADQINHPKDSRNYICYIRKYENFLYMLRFGKHLVELWRLRQSQEAELDIQGDVENTSELESLLFIHAYKATDYGFHYTFKELWSLSYKDESSIKVIQNKNDSCATRVLINTVIDPCEEYTDFGDECSSEASNNILFPQKNVEELFIPFSQLVRNKKLSRNNLFLHLKSSCQALYYLCQKNVPDLYKDNLETLLSKTKDVIKNCLEEIGSIKRQQDYKYFTSISGSNLLAMLASFREGRAILFQILQYEKIPISLFSYTRRLTKKQFKESLSTNENAMIVLIEEKSYDLYKLLFNRVLSDSKTIGVGCLSVFTDVLIFLQERANHDLLLSSSEKLSYLHINKHKLPMLEEEISSALDMPVRSKFYLFDSRIQQSFSSREQITQYSNTFIDRIKYSITKLLKYNDIDLISDIGDSAIAQTTKSIGIVSTTLNFFSNIYDNIVRELNKSHQSPSKLATLCVVPLPHFLSYSDFPEDRIKEVEIGSSKESEVIPYKSESAFVRIATNQKENSIFRQGDPFLRILIQYKWDNFIYFYYFIMYFVCITYYVSFFTAVSFSREYFDYQFGSPITNIFQGFWIILMFSSIGLLIIQEIRQMSKSYNKFEYLTSFYNWVDWTAFGLSIAAYISMVTGGDNFQEINSFATLIIWLHAILKLRVFSVMGVTLETTIQILKSIKGVLLIMLFVICAFTHTFIALLSHEKDEFFQEQFYGKINNDSASVSLSDVSSQNNFAVNGFVDILKPFSILWFFIYGVWDPITDGDAGDSKIIMFMAILFSFITVLILFNIVIAYMNSSIEEVQKGGKKAWISHFAAVVAEIEQSWCLPSSKYKKAFNPAYIYYIAHVDKVYEKEEALDEETQSLFKKLTPFYSREETRGITHMYEMFLEEMKGSMERETRLVLESLNISSEIKDPFMKEIRRKDKHFTKKLDFLKNNLIHISSTKDIEYE